MRLPRLDDTQRSALLTAGGVLMGGGITWLVSTFTGEAHIPIFWRVFPGATAFAFGVALFAYAFLSRPNPRRELLDRLIAGGRAVAKLEDPGARGFAWDEWRKEVSAQLRTQLGFDVAIQFGKHADVKGDLDSIIASELMALEELRKAH